MNHTPDLLTHPFAVQLGLVPVRSVKTRGSARAPKPGVGKNPGSSPSVNSSLNRGAAVATQAPATTGLQPTAVAGAATSEDFEPAFWINATGQLVIDLPCLTEPLLLTPAQQTTLHRILNQKQGNQQ